MADPSGRRPRYHPAVNDILSTLADASASLADVQRRLDLEFRASYPDPVSILALLPNAPSGARLTGSAAAVAGEPGEAGGAGEAGAGGGGRAQGALPRPPHPEAGAPPKPKSQIQFVQGKRHFSNLWLRFRLGPC